MLGLCSIPFDAGFSTDSLVLVDFLAKVGTTLNCLETGRQVPGARRERVGGYAPRSEIQFLKGNGNIHGGWGVELKSGGINKIVLRQNCSIKIF